MPEVLEFFVPTRVAELEDASKVGKDHYLVEMTSDFAVPAHQQLDDITRLFDSLHREKSPTALFSKADLFSPLYSYIKAIDSGSPKEVEVTKATRHKICHEVGERMKKLLQICLAYMKRRGELPSQNGSNEALEVCLRSTLKMYIFVLCNILMSVAPTNESTEGGFQMSQRAGGRKRKRGEVDAGFGDDGSGVDMDGRELALTAMIEFLSAEIVSLWSGHTLEDTTLNLILKMSLRMITQKANIGGDAQSISGALALLLARLMHSLLAKNESLDAGDLVAPMVELSLKSESAALFLSKFVADMEQEDSSSAYSNRVIRALFESMSYAAVSEAATDNGAAKNIATFFSEVSKRSVSVTVTMADTILPIIQSENYDIRKAVITCIAEMTVQRYTGHSRGSDDDCIRNKYLNELLFRVMDVNPFVRNHTLHTWERLVDAKAVPKRYHLALAEAVVSRLEDKNYLVRDSAMMLVSTILRKNWFGHILKVNIIQEKVKESKDQCAELFEDAAVMDTQLSGYRKQFQPAVESLEDNPLEENEKDAVPSMDLSEGQVAALNKYLFYESALSYVLSMQKALHHGCILLDSRTERDVVEAIKLVVACSEYRLEGCETAFLKVMVKIFEGELKIQLSVRDAFAEVFFLSFSRLPGSAVTRATASAQKLISVMRDANEGEVSAVDRIVALLKVNNAYSRYISGHFTEAIWGIAEGSVDREATMDDRRTAVRVYSILSKHYWKDVKMRKESLLEYLESDTISKDNIVLSYVFSSLQNESLDPNYVPIPSTEDPRGHPVLKHLVNHLCRPTEAMASWMSLASAAVNAIHHLCEIPVPIYLYILQYIGSHLQLGTRTDNNTRSQLYFLVGMTALKQLVAVETAERLQLKALEAPSQPDEAAEEVGTDSMHKELGLGSHEFKRHAIQELGQQRRRAIMSESSLWSTYAKEVVGTCQLKASALADRPMERVCAALALCQLMIVNEDFCEKHLNLLFTIVADKRESWIVKTNIVIALGDLACVHPNLLGPYLSVPTTGFFKMLVDDDLRVRAVTIQVCSHLVLGDMFRIRDHLYTIVKLVADPDESIARHAVTFVQNLAMKEKEKTGNLIPPLVSQLSCAMPVDKFHLAMRTLLERVDGDKPIDSLIDRLCQRFEAYSERSKKKLQLAQNIAFCLSELNYTTERAVKRIMSEACYQQYKHWLRDSEVFEYFKGIANKAKKPGRVGSERRDRSSIEEWESRMLIDSCSQEDKEEETIEG